MVYSNTDNKTIAKNTAYLYIRTFLTMLITLYTSRVVLSTLGFEDYGIYNVVGGIASSFTFLSSMFSNATQRYLNFAIGQNNPKEANELFNMNMLIYFTYGIIAILIIEVAGAWFVEYKMTISPTRVNAAYWCLHTTSLILFVTLISTVYEAVLIAHENMKVYAFMGIYDAFIKLLIIYLISILTFDRLILYAILMLILHISVRLIPTVYTILHYEETKLILFWDKNKFKEISKFIGWNFIGTIVFILNDQGINILLNLFFGPIINAARAISMQVKNSISNFSMSFFTAVRPQIVKSYAQKDYNRFKELIFNSSKYTFFLLLLVCLPITLRINNILSIWLKNVPEWTGDFVIWTLAFNIFNSSFCDPIWQGIQAIGKLKRYVLIGSLTYSLAFPISFIAFYMHGLPILAFQILLAIRICYFLVTIKIFRKEMPFSYKNYLHTVIKPITTVSVISIVLSIMINSFLSNSFFLTMIACIATALTVSIVIYTIGLSDKERYTVKHIIKNKLCIR